MRRALAAILTRNRLLTLAAAGILAASFVWTPDALPRIELCAMHRLTGIPCPGCGLTRSFCAISHGDFAAAYHFNPFGYLFYVAALLAAVDPIARKLAPTAAARLSGSRYLAFAVPALVGAMIIFGGIRAFGSVSFH